MSGQIFISYRRGQDSWVARSLYDRLIARFDSKQIFIDVNGIDPGEEFPKVIEKMVGECGVLIAVIGARWLTSTDKQGGRALDNPKDFVRMEIGTALRRDIRVIPVLVDGASMPLATDLPDDLKQLVRRQALRIAHSHFDHGWGKLEVVIEQVLGKNTAAWRKHQKPGPRAKSPLKQLIAFLAIAALLVIPGLLYLVKFQLPAHQWARVLPWTPSPSVSATPPVEEKALPTQGVLVDPRAPDRIPVVKPGIPTDPPPVPDKTPLSDL
jgi:TIR domain-containing protein